MNSSAHIFIENRTRFRSHGWVLITESIEQTNFNHAKSFLFYTQANQHDRKRIAEIELPNSEYEHRVYCIDTYAMRACSTSGWHYVIRSKKLWPTNNIPYYSINCAALPFVPLWRNVVIEHLKWNLFSNETILVETAKAIFRQ